MLAYKRADFQFTENILYTIEKCLHISYTTVVVYEKYVNFSMVCKIFWVRGQHLLYFWL